MVISKIVNWKVSALLPTHKIIAGVLKNLKEEEMIAQWYFVWTIVGKGEVVKMEFVSVKIYILDLIAVYFKFKCILSK